MTSLYLLTLTPKLSHENKKSREPRGYLKHNFLKKSEVQITEPIISDYTFEPPIRSMLECSRDEVMECVVDYYTTNLGTLISSNIF